MGLVAADGQWIEVNRAICRLSGQSEEELLHSSLQDLLTADRRDAAPHGPAPLGELAAAGAPPARRRFVRANGEHGEALLTVTKVPDGDGVHDEFIAQIEDVSELQRLTERLGTVAPPDALTGLSSRRLFIRDLALQVGRCRRYGERAALVLLDVDGFTAFNEAHGRPAGDRALIAVADTLRGRLRSTDVIARVGGDEFAALLPADSDAAHLGALLGQLIAAAPIPVGDGHAHVSVSVGVQRLDGSALSAEVVLADLERGTLAPLAAGHVGPPSRATASSPGLRVMQWTRRRLGIGAIAVAAGAGIAYGLVAVVSRPHGAVTPAPVPNAVFRISGKNLGVSASGAFAVQAACSDATCRGVLAVTSTAAPARTAAHRRARTIVIARARFALPPGATSRVPVMLNAGGRRLFAGHGGHLAAALTATLQGGTRASPALGVTLTRAATGTPGAGTPGSPSAATSAPSAASGTPAPQGVAGDGSPTSAETLGTPSGACQNADDVPTAGTIAQSDQSALCLVNNQRIAAGIAPLRENALLDQAADAHTTDMIANDYFAHVSPSGVTVLDWVSNSGYLLPNAGYVLGENIAWGTYTLATPDSIVAAWMNSPDHRANILNAGFDDAGMAVAASVPASLALGQPGALYTQVFAGPNG